MAVYHGKSGVVYMSTSGSTAAINVGKLSDWSIDMSTDTVETTSFGDTNKTFVQGLPQISGSMSGFWTDAEDTLFTASSSSDGCKIYIYPSSAAPTKYLCGLAWVSVSMSAAVGDAVKVSVNFSANGSWRRAPGG